MLREQKSLLKPPKKQSVDSSSEVQKGQGKKIEDSSSSDVPKRRNRKVRISMTRVRETGEDAEEGERPVLTEGG